MSTNERPLSGRTALVTGGAKGIGRACCQRLAEAGADVAANYLTSDAEARETAQLIHRAGGKAHLFRADISVPEQVEALVADVEAALGPVDLLVNNAGVFPHGTHQELTPEVWRRTLDVNLTGTFLTTWAVKPGMVQRQFGRIVNVSSIAGLRPRPASIAYAVSKAGMVSLTKSLAEALAPHNIRVNAVAPGLIDTDIIADVSREKIDELVQATPMRRLGEPLEIADAVLFLVTDQSSFMTGQTLVASGGRVMLP